MADVTDSASLRMSFSGQDADVYCCVPSADPLDRVGLVYLDSIQTISVSTFRDKVPVRSIGYTNVRGHTRGVRTIAGSMIFAVMNAHPLYELFRRYNYEFSYDRYSGLIGSGEANIFPDVIPPFNVFISYQNELGGAAIIELIGIDITNDGIVTSIEDLLTEKTIQYRARDMRVFTAIEGANGFPAGSRPTREQVDLLLNGVGDTSYIDPLDLWAGTKVSIPVADGKSLSDKLKGLL